MKTLNISESQINKNYRITFKEKIEPSEVDESKRHNFSHDIIVS